MSVAGRKAVVAREHASEPGTYEVAYKDGSEPASALVTVEYMQPAAK